MACCMGCPSSPAGSGRKSAKPNQRVSSLRASWRSRHQPQAGSAQALSLSRRYQPPRLRELMAHPGRHDRVAAGHRQPGQRVGQRPAGNSPPHPQPRGREWHRRRPPAARVSPRLPRRPKGGASGEARRRNRRVRGLRLPAPAWSANATLPAGRDRPPVALSVRRRRPPAQDGRRVSGSFTRPRLSPPSW